MNKELSPLEALKEIGQYEATVCTYKGAYPSTFTVEDTDYFEIIETALKRLDDLQQMLYKMNVKYGYKEYLKIIKALEIINKKNVCIATLKDSNSLEEYNDVICYHKVHSMSLTKPLFLEQNEFDLLKEVLL